MGSHQTLLLKGHLTTRQLVAAALLSGAVFASPWVIADESNSNGTSWGLGLGVMSQQKPYAGFDRDNTPVPLLLVENRYLRVFGPEVEFKLPRLDISASQQLHFGVVAQYDGSGYEQGDAAILNGMSERKGGFWAGATVEWSSDIVNVSAKWLTDVSDNSDGHRINVGLERTWQFGEHVLLTPRLGATWQDEESVDYYFGVRNSEARFDRPAYAGESAINIEAGMRGVYRFNQHHSVLMGVEVTSLADEIEDSPLVDRSTENSVFLGYLYHF